MLRHTLFQAAVICLVTQIKAEIPEICKQYNYTGCTSNCSQSQCNNTPKYITNVCTKTGGCICQPGLQRSDCSEKCDAGRYGIACILQCTSCNNSVCNVTTGCPKETTSLPTSTVHSPTAVNHKTNADTYHVTIADTETATTQDSLGNREDNRSNLQYVIITAVSVTTVLFLMLFIICLVRKRTKRIARSIAGQHANCNTSQVVATTTPVQANNYSYPEVKLHVEPSTEFKNDVYNVLRENMDINRGNDNTYDHVTDFNETYHQLNFK